MQRELAQRVALLLERADASLHEAYRELHEAPEAATNDEAKKRIALVMSLLFQGVTKHIYAAHPAVCPEEFRWIFEPRYAASDHWPWAREVPGWLPKPGGR